MKRAASLAIATLLGCSSATGIEPEPRPEARWADIGRTCSADAPSPSLSTAARDALPPVQFPGDLNAQWAALAARVPGGWGGSFVDDGVPRMYLVDPSQKEAALAALGSALLPSTVDVRQGRWDFAQLYDWYRYVRHHVRVEGVSSTDIQEARNRIEYGVIDEQVWQRLEQSLSALDVPCYLVAVRIQGYAETR